MKTKGAIKEQARFILDQLETGWLENNPLNRYGLNDAVDDALEEYAIKTHCYLTSATVAATPDTSEYLYSVFGTRLFEIRCVAFDGDMLKFITSDELDQQWRDWRFESSGTPQYWMPWGNRKLKLYRTPDSTDNIYVEGYETHNPTDFDTDAKYPPGIPAEDHGLLAYGAAMMVVLRGIDKPEIQARAQAIEQAWAAGLQDAARKAHQAHKTDLVVGKWADMNTSDWPNVSETIINI